MSLVRPGGGPGTCGHTELVENVADVTSHGSFADKQRLRRLTVRFAGGEQTKNFNLPIAERADPPARGRGCLVCDSCEASGGVEPAEPPLPTAHAQTGSGRVPRA